MLNMWPKKLQKFLSDAKKKIELSEKNLVEKLKEEVTVLDKNVANIEIEFKELAEQ